MPHCFLFALSKRTSITLCSFHLNNFIDQMNSAPDPVPYWKSLSFVSCSEVVLSDKRESFSRRKTSKFWCYVLCEVVSAGFWLSMLENFLATFVFISSSHSRIDGTKIVNIVHLFLVCRCLFQCGGIMHTRFIVLQESPNLFELFFSIPRNSSTFLHSVIHLQTTWFPGHSSYLCSMIYLWLKDCSVVVGKKKLLGIIFGYFLMMKHIPCV